MHLADILGSPKQEIDMNKLLGRLFLSGLMLWQSLLPAMADQPFQTGPIPAQAPVVQQPSSQPATPRPAEARKVHLILTGLTVNYDIGPNCRQDIQAMTDQFTHGFQSIGPDRLVIHALYGEQWTKDKVVQYLRGMNIDANDVVVFYQSGHGGIRNPSQPQQTLEFQVNGAEYLSRGELLNILRQKPCRGMVILTDCCSSYAGPASRSAGLDSSREQPAMNAATIRNLFLRFQGFVDITAAEAGVGASAANVLNNFGGASSAFTVAFFVLACDGNHAYQNWNEFYSVLRIKTQESSGGSHRAFAFQINEGTAPIPVQAPSTPSTPPAANPVPAPAQGGTGPITPAPSHTDRPEPRK